MMNLKIKHNGLEIEMERVKEDMAKRTLLGVFAYFEGESFEEGYKGEFSDVVEPLMTIGDVDIVEEKGIRIVKNGLKLYKGKSKCSCGGNGEVYISTDVKELTCPLCFKTLEVKFFVPGIITGYDFGKNGADCDGDKFHDKEFNYFIAE